MSTPLPLILQIQQAAIDGSAPLGEAFLKAKVACAKLKLVEFGKWIDLETSGYPDIGFNEMPDYRKIQGVPQAKNPYYGWQDIGFADQDTFTAMATVPISTPISTLESQVKNSTPDGCFEFHYTIDQQNRMRDSLGGYQWPIRLKLDIGMVRGIVDRVRLILTDWTIQLEKEGVLGEAMSFTGNDKDSSAKATETVINNYHMGDVGAFVQTADQSSVVGTVQKMLDLGQVDSLTRQIEGLKALLPAETWNEVEPAVETVKQELAGAKDQARIRGALRLIGDACMKVGTSVAASGIVHAVGALLA